MIEEKLFYSEILKLNDNDILVKGFRKLGNGHYGESTSIISTKSITWIINTLDNFKKLEHMNLSEEINNGLDRIKIYIEGSFQVAVVKIYIYHKENTENYKRGVIAIPYRPYDEEYAFRDLRPFMEQLKKYAN